MISEPVGSNLEGCSHNSLAPTQPHAAGSVRLLFVVADEPWFHQVERELHEIEPRLSCSFSLDGTLSKALQAPNALDGLVVDADSPGAMSLVEETERFGPVFVRLVRCNFRDRNGLARWNRPGLTLVSTEEGAEALATAFWRSRRLQSWMADPSVKRLLPLLRKLPAAPRLFGQITEELRSPNGSIEMVAHLISQEPVMSAKILQVVNSAFFGLAQPITDPGEAVLHLGTERTRSLILLASVFSHYDDIRCPGFSSEPIWEHSLQVGSLARQIAEEESRDPKTCNLAFTAGLLHDVGKLILAGNLPDMYAVVRQRQAKRKQESRLVELEVIGTTHAELGACLLGTWGLPLPLLEAIAWHHGPDQSPDEHFSPLTAVHVANALAHEVGSPSAVNTLPDPIHLPYLTRVGLDQHRNRWRALAGLPPEDNEQDRIRRRREAKEN